MILILKNMKGLVALLAKQAAALAWIVMKYVNL